MVKYKDLSEVEKKWLDHWIDGLAIFIARSPGESQEKFKGQIETVKKILMEKRDELADKAIKWRERLLKAVSL